MNAPPNQFRERARDRKAAKLVAAIDADWIATFGAGAPFRHARAIASRLREWGDAEWQQVADAAGTRPPKSSRQAVIATYEARAAQSEPRRCPMGHENCQRASCAEEAGIAASQGRAV